MRQQYQLEVKWINQHAFILPDPERYMGTKSCILTYKALSRIFMSDIACLDSHMYCSILL